jgi:hypothetical protein
MDIIVSNIKMIVWRTQNGMVDYMPLLSALVGAFLSTVLGKIINALLQTV